MHPADEFDAFKALIESGMPAADVAARFTPTPGNYFGSISKAAIIDVLREIKGDVAPAWNGMKKTELAALAERATRGTRWLPAIFRLPALRQGETSEAKH
jgi:hypothetical protein